MIIRLYSYDMDTGNIHLIKGHHIIIDGGTRGEFYFVRQKIITYDGCLIDSA